MDVSADDTTQDLYDRVGKWLSTTSSSSRCDLDSPEGPGDSHSETGSDSEWTLAALTGATAMAPVASWPTTCSTTTTTRDHDDDSSESPLPQPVWGPTPTPTLSNLKLRLTVEDRELQHMEWRLRDYGLGPLSTVRLKPRLLGGVGGNSGSSGSGSDTIASIEFSSLSAKPERRPWSDSAPPYRMACPGLALEGMCSNPVCASYIAKTRVILPIGFVEGFDLNRGRFDKSCPSCKSLMDPSKVTTCAVSNCQWSFDGRVVDPGNPHGKARKGSGRADDAYHLFSGANKDMVTWHYISFTAKRA